MCVSAPDLNDGLISMAQHKGFYVDLGKEEMHRPPLDIALYRLACSVDAGMHSHPRAGHL
jgi:hypothetical protein